jgi:hypothetical protein
MNGGLVSRFWSFGKIWGILVLFSMYMVMLFTDWNSPIKIWLSAGWVGRKSFWAVWAVYGLPLWALAIILFPHVLRDLTTKPQPPMYTPVPSEPFAFFGWLMMGFSYVALLVFKA